MQLTVNDYKQGIEDAGSDNREVFGGTWTGGYHIQQDPEEFAQLLSVLQKEGVATYLQIGIAAGGSERYIAEACDIAGLVVIDDGRHPNNRVWRSQNKPAIEGRDVKVTEFIGNSHAQSAHDFLGTLEGSKFSLIGIDGDHSPGGVRLDWELIQPYIGNKGLVWLHDIHLAIPGQTGARELWQHLKKDSRFEVILETSGRFGIGLLRKK